MMTVGTDRLFMVHTCFSVVGRVPLESDMGISVASIAFSAKLRSVSAVDDSSQNNRSQDTICTLPGSSCQSAYFTASCF